MFVSISIDRQVCLFGRHLGSSEDRGPEIDVIRKRRALLREVNEHIRHANGSLAPNPGSYLVICECERAECFSRLEVSAHLYDQVRSDSGRFLVIAGHEDPDVERVLAGDDYSVVRVRDATKTARSPGYGLNAAR